MSGAVLANAAIWYVHNVDRKSAMRVDKECSENGENTWRQRVRELETENARLQALVCYLVHCNEELRRMPGGKESAGLVD